MIDFKSVEAVLSIAGMMFGGLALAISWLTRGSKTNAVKIEKLAATSTNEIEKLKAENANLTGRIADLETVIQNQPTKDDIHKLTLQIIEMGGQMNTVSAELKAVGRIATRIDDFLLNK